MGTKRFVKRYSGRSPVAWSSELTGKSRKIIIPRQGRSQSFPEAFLKHSRSSPKAFPSRCPVRNGRKLPRIGFRRLTRSAARLRGFQGKLLSFRVAARAETRGVVYPIAEQVSRFPRVASVIVRPIARARKPPRRKHNSRESRRGYLCETSRNRTGRVIRV